MNKRQLEKELMKDKYLKLLTFESEVFPNLNFIIRDRGLYLMLWLNDKQPVVFPVELKNIPPLVKELTEIFEVWESVRT